MSELKKELEQDKAFVEEVSNRIYSDMDDIDEYMPEPEWIDRMTDIADKYLTRFETSYNFANILADELLASNIQLNYNQNMVLEWLKEKTCKCNKPVYPMNLVRKAVEKMPVEIVNYYDHLSDKEEYEVLSAFAQWGLEQEEEK